MSIFNFEGLRGGDSAADSTATDLLGLPLFRALTRTAEKSLSPASGDFVVQGLAIGDDKDDDEDDGGGGSGDEQAMGDDRWLGGLSVLIR